MNVLIINADDFGRDEETSRAIEECFKKGYVNQATLMVNMPYADSAVELAKKSGFVDRVGLHLNLTQGTPLTDAIKEFPDFCNDSGDFWPNRVGCDWKKLPDNMFNAIAEEVAAQAKRYISFGLPLMHCDGHHHVHNRVGLCSVILSVLKKMGFTSVRNRYTIFSPPWHSVRGRVGNFIFRQHVRRLGLRTTAAFGGWDGESLDKWHRFKSVEIMVHPHYAVNGDLINVIDSMNNTGPKMEGLCVRQ